MSEMSEINEWLVMLIDVGFLCACNSVLIQLHADVVMSVPVVVGFR